MITQQLLFAIGLSFVFFGIIVVVIGLIFEIVRGAKKKENREERQGERESKTEYGGVIFIGPIPIVFGSNKDMAKLALIIGLVMFILVILLMILSLLA
ncbi:TIGR00304 family membrane protein [Stygiolobus caldivivus]|uniref:TIGR00304 family protein n=1 Tax=Stygiolobus caldivivus TaxID=2824673 RepID=A0A8D5ZI40_9CREN|nr:DUF131 domain-containing protein [Stygiolobus caldivivus]BCU70274.1 hypothetical protein KN1_15710 [Stygiolobus caldivivus]